jgi:hypothetical protein
MLLLFGYYGCVSLSLVLYSPISLLLRTKEMTKDVQRVETATRLEASASRELERHKRLIALQEKPEKEASAKRAARAKFSETK